MGDAEKAFQEAQTRVKGLRSAPSVVELLGLYSLYKQATVGDATGSRPGILDPRGRAKFDAWKSRNAMSVQDAQAAYVQLVDQLVAARGLSK